MTLTLYETKKNPSTGKYEKTGRTLTVGKVKRKGGGYETGVTSVKDASGRVVETTKDAVQSTTAAKAIQQRTQTASTPEPATLATKEQQKKELTPGELLREAQRSPELLAALQEQSKAPIGTQTKVYQTGADTYEIESTTTTTTTTPPTRNLYEKNAVIQPASDLGPPRDSWNIAIGGDVLRKMEQSAAAYADKANKAEPGPEQLKLKSLSVRDYILPGAFRVLQIGNPDVKRNPLGQLPGAVASVWKTGGAPDVGPAIRDNPEQIIGETIGSGVTLNVGARFLSSLAPLETYSISRVGTGTTQTIRIGETTSDVTAAEFRASTQGNKQYRITTESIGTTRPDVTATRTPPGVTVASGEVPATTPAPSIRTEQIRINIQELGSADQVLKEYTSIGRADARVTNLNKAVRTTGTYGQITATDKTVLAQQGRFSALTRQTGEATYLTRQISTTGPTTKISALPEDVQPNIYVVTKPTPQKPTGATVQKSTLLAEYEQPLNIRIGETTGAEPITVYTQTKPVQQQLYSIETAGVTSPKQLPNTQPTPTNPLTRAINRLRGPRPPTSATATESGKTIIDVNKGLGARSQAKSYAEGRTIVTAEQYIVDDYPVKSGLTNQQTAQTLQDAPPSSTVDKLTQEALNKIIQTGNTQKVILAPTTTITTARTTTQTIANTAKPSTFTQITNTQTTSNKPRANTIQTTNQNQRDKYRTTTRGNTTPANKIERALSPATSSRQTTGTTTAQTQRIEQAQITEQIPVQSQTIKYAPITTSTQPIPPEIIPTLTTPPIIPPPTYKTPIKGYNVLVRRRGVFKQANPSPLERSDALRFGAATVGTTAAASFKIVPTDAPATKYSGPSGIIEDFEQKNGVFIEKRGRRIKSPGELQEITFKGLTSRRQKSRLRSVMK